MVTIDRLHCDYLSIKAMIEWPIGVVTIDRLHCDYLSIKAMIEWPIGGHYRQVTL